MTKFGQHFDNGNSEFFFEEKYKNLRFKSAFHEAVYYFLELFELIFCDSIEAFVDRYSPNVQREKQEAMKNGFESHGEFAPQEPLNSHIRNQVFRQTQSHNKPFGPNWWT